MNELIFDAFDHYVSSYRKDRQRVDRVKYREVCDDFLSLLDEKIGVNHIGENWLNLYYIWTFDYWIGKNVKFGKNLHIKKVLSKAGLMRFLKRSKDFNWYMAKKNLRISPFKAPEKIARFDRRSIYKSFNKCHVNDLKYNGSMSCMMCSDKKICKKL